MTNVSGCCGKNTGVAENVHRPKAQPTVRIRLGDDSIKDADVTVPQNLQDPHMFSIRPEQWEASKKIIKT